MRVPGGCSRSTSILSPVIDHNFGPPSPHIHCGPGEMDRFAARIGPQTQAKQIGQTEGSLYVQPVVSFKSDSNRECRRRKTLQRFSRAREGAVRLAEFRLEPEM